MTIVIPPSSAANEESPYRPGFGTTPPVAVGRQPEVNAFARALDQRGGTGRTVFVTGQRGVGKTVLLNIFEDVAESRQWLTVREQASPGFVDRLTQARLPEALEAHDAHVTTKSKIVGFTLPGGAGGLTTRTETTSALQPDFRHHLMSVLEILDAHGTGLVIALDEVHRSNIDEFRAVTDAVAYAMSQEAPLAFVAAGLPASIDTIVNDEVSTFLRRADRINLGSFSAEDTKLALRLPAEEAGKGFDEAALDLGAQVSLGYPYMVQIIGDLAWRAAGEADRIARTDVESVVDEAKQILIQQIYEPTLAALTPGARKYLAAMADDEDISHTGEIADRLGAKKQTANDYRRMLLAHGVIEAPAHGVVRIVIPHFREYVRDRTGDR